MVSPRRSPLRPLSNLPSARSPHKLLPSSGSRPGMKENARGDRYGAIALLDDDQEEEKWSERTSVITAHDHQTNLVAAAAILEEVVAELEVPRSEDTSFASISRDSESEGFASALQLRGHQEAPLRQPPGPQGASPPPLAPPPPACPAGRGARRRPPPPHTGRTCS